MRIVRYLSQLVDTYGPYIPFLGSSPPSTSEMKHKKNSFASSPPKGKGKGKDKSTLGNSGETVDLKDLPIRLPEFANGDHAKVVPRYSAVLKRSEQDGIGMEDIDTLQMELEAMLSSVVVRKMTLKEEVQVLSEAEKYKGSGKFNKRVRILRYYILQPTYFIH